MTLSFSVFIPECFKHPHMQVNTDGLVLRGWYTCLTVAVYGTAERSHGHGQDSPPPPPPPPPQQPSGPKRITKPGLYQLTEGTTVPFI